jgi:hypothetical protein
MADKPAPSQARGLPSFENIAAQPLDSWKAVNDETTTPYVKLLAWRIAKLSMDGLKGIDTINYWISRRIQPLQHRDSLMHEYTGANDGMRYSDQKLDPRVVEKRIRSLMKSPRKKPLKFGMAMFENGSCPSVSYTSAMVFVVGMTYRAYHRPSNMPAGVPGVPTASAREDRLRPKGQLCQQPAGDSTEESWSRAQKARFLQRWDHQKRPKPDKIDRGQGRDDACHDKPQPIRDRRPFPTMGSEAKEKGYAFQMLVQGKGAL